MAGFTIIHLSDLHIVDEKEVSDNSFFNILADFTAESLAEDFRKVAEEHSINPRPEETLLVITGDITSQAKWEHYEKAISFIQKLQKQLAQCMEGKEFPPEHIICIPGNHDIEFQNEKVDDAEFQRKTKYRNFKLFLEEITEYSSFARNFTLTNPFVNVHIPAQFPIQILDLNTTLNISYIEETASFTIDQKNTLDTFLKKQNDSLFDKQHDQVEPLPLRIALMHHHLDNFPSEDVDNKMSRRTLLNWLITNGFKIALCGHDHLATGEEVKPAFIEKGLLILGTGRSFLVGRHLDKGNHYQILRIEQSKKDQVLVVNRKFMYEKPLTPSNPKDAGKWDLNIQGTLPIPGLTKIIGATDFQKFIGIKSPQDWAVVAHCESSKFQNYGISSPGEQVNSNLRQISGSIEGKWEPVYEDSKVNWGKYSTKSALFLIDSPHYNPYVRDILEKYSTYLAGGVVKFVDLGKKPVEQSILIRNEELKVEKKDHMKLFDKFADYLLVMRLPGFIPEKVAPDVKIPDIDRNKVIWVVAGIHSKASYAGAMIFTMRNFPLFTANLRDKCGGKLPEYFEAVYKTRIEPEKIEKFNHLELVHVRELRLKSEIAMADDLPSGVAVRFLHKDLWRMIPLSTVHFDPVAACNFNCRTCIEKAVREKKLFLSMSTCARILLDLKDCGCQNLNFYGGEPTLHPDFDNILRLSSHLGFDILLVTNGSRLGEESIFKAIVDGRNRIHVRVSIDANSPESHKGTHRLSKNHFDNIVAWTEQLIQQGVSTSISFLLHKESIHEIDEAAKFWKSRHASAFILRPLTGQSGMSPELRYNQAQKKMMRKVIKDYNGFVFTPNWFQEWIFKDKHPEIQKECGVCYSGYYRVAISPYNATDNSRKCSIENIEMVEVSNAWISLCTYQRYNPNYGCEYPQDLKAWCQTDRQKALEKINPATQCNKIICCRHDYNRQIKNLINSQSIKNNGVLLR